MKFVYCASTCTIKRQFAWHFDARFGIKNIAMVGDSKGVLGREFFGFLSFFFSFFFFVFAYSTSIAEESVATLVSEVFSSVVEGDSSLLDVAGSIEVGS